MRDGRFDSVQGEGLIVGSRAESGRAIQRDRCRIAAVESCGPGFDCTTVETHQDPVGMGEVSELILEVACPFLAVKEVIAEAPDDDQHGDQPVTWIVVAALENRLDNSGFGPRRS